MTTAIDLYDPTIWARVAGFSTLPSRWMMKWMWSGMMPNSSSVRPGYLSGNDCHVSVKMVRNCGFSNMGSCVSARMVIK